MLNGKIWLDSNWDSGIPNNPGTRFVIDLLGTSPLAEFDECHLSNPSSASLQILSNGCNTRNSLPMLSKTLSMSTADSNNDVPSTNDLFPSLPNELSILFVDDDLILRRLFARCIKNVAPNWVVREAANGETALKLVSQQHFDLIFMDQYMAAVEKTLLGHETVARLRQGGCSARICGLSANDVEELFIQAGADCFVFKPFPCEKEAMIQELKSILFAKKYVNRRSSCGGKIF